MIFNRKTTAEIEAKARAKERAICEQFYLAELECQRQRYAKKITEQKISLEKEHENNIKETEIKFGIELVHYQNKISDLQSQIKDNQKAWQLYKEFIPRAVKLAGMLKTNTYVKLDEASRQFKHASMIEDDLESLDRDLSRIIPRVEKIMRIEQ